MWRDRGAADRGAPSELERGPVAEKGQALNWMNASARVIGGRGRKFERRLPALRPHRYGASGQTVTAHTAAVNGNDVDVQRAGDTESPFLNEAEPGVGLIASHAELRPSRRSRLTCQPASHRGVVRPSWTWTWSAMFPKGPTKIQFHGPCIQAQAFSTVNAPTLPGGSVIRMRCVGLPQTLDFWLTISTIGHAAFARGDPGCPLNS